MTITLLRLARFIHDRRGEYGLQTPGGVNGDNRPNGQRAKAYRKGRDKGTDDRPQSNHQPDQKGGQRRQAQQRSEEHTSELQSLMRNSYAVFCLKKKKQKI